MLPATLDLEAVPEGGASSYWAYIWARPDKHTPPRWANHLVSTARPDRSLCGLQAWSGDGRTVAVGPVERFEPHCEACQNFRNQFSPHDGSPALTLDLDEVG